MYTSAERLIIKPHERREELPNYPQAVIICHHPDYLTLASEFTHELAGFSQDVGWSDQAHYRQKYYFKGIPFVIDDARDSARGTMRHTERHYMWGARLIINIGAVGGIAPNLDYGDFVIGERAIRDNGIDHDLATPDEEARSTVVVNEALKSILIGKRESTEIVEKGDVWTVGHKYYTWDRLHEIQQNIQYAIKAVDMEMAPFCIMTGWLNANYSRNIGVLKIGNFFYVSDLLPKTEHDQWVDTINDVQQLLPFKRAVLRWTIKAIVEMQTNNI